MALGKAIMELARNRRRATQPVVEDKPGCAFGLVTRRGLDDLSRDFERLENKINGVIFGVMVTFLVELWKAFR